MTHYYPHVHAGALRLEGRLAVGDTIHIRGHTTDYYQRIERMEHEHEPVESAGPGMEIAVRVSQRVREGDRVYRLSKSSERQP